MKKIPISLAWLVALTSLGVYANFLDGNELRVRCESDHPHEINTCLGYLTGIADAEDAAPSWKLQQSLFCLPRGVSANQLRGTVLEYFKAHPEEEDLNAAIVVGNALLEAFPCESPAN
jgi:Rap1a immunity proteins